MSKKILVNARNLEEYRVAIIEDGFLTNHSVSTSGRRHSRGNIYKARVASVEKSLQAAFMEFGAKRNGFLPLKDIHPSYYSEDSVSGRNKRARVENVVDRGQELLVQICREASGKKGAALTTYLSLTGRYLVLLPGADKHGVSRKIEDAKERHRLRSLIDEFDVPKGLGLIMRTAGEGRTKADIQRDLRYLYRLWDTLKKHAIEDPTPSLIYSEADPAVSTLRDYFTADVKEVMIDTKEAFEQVRNFTSQVMPRYVRRLKLYQSDQPLFDRYHLEEQIEKMFSQRVNLKSGGHIVIEETEAMATVDVNSGRFTKGAGMEDTAYQTNMEAVEEIVRQLRLRDIGGIIALDFIDMRDSKHRMTVERLLRENLKSDKAKWDITRINKLGVLVMSRQRLSSSLSETSFITCPRCLGSGTVKSPATMSIHVLRKLNASTFREGIAGVTVRVHPVVAEFLLNERRQDLVTLEGERSLTIRIVGDPSVNYSDFREEFVKAPPKPAQAADPDAEKTSSAKEIESKKPASVKPSGTSRSTSKSPSRSTSKSPSRSTSKSPSRSTNRSTSKSTDGTASKSSEGNTENSAGKSPSRSAAGKVTRARRRPRPRRPQANRSRSKSESSSKTGRSEEA